MQTLLKIHSLATQYFQDNLKASQSARRYLYGRGVDERMIERFQLGLASNGLVAWLKGQGYTSEQIVEAGLGAHGEPVRDRFRDRIIVPTHDVDGRVIAFGARALREDQKPKYLNSPETPIYSKRAVLFNLHRALPHIQEQGAVILVEGYMDVIGLDRAGIFNAVATCGTSITESHAALIAQYCDRCYLNYDSDEAGLKAAHRAIAVLLNAGMEPRVVRLRGAKDPDEYVRKFGVDAYRQQVEQSQSYLAWAIETARALHDNLEHAGRVETLRWLMPLVGIARSNGAAEVVPQVSKQLSVSRSITESCLKHAGPKQYGRRDLDDALALGKRICL